VGDAECHHCRFIQDDFDWDIWIDAGERPLVHKVVPNLAKQLTGEGADPELAKVKMDFAVTFTDWNTEPKFTPADFTFTPPSGAEQAESLFEGREQGPHAMLGEPAPPFKTTDADEQPFDLGEHVGKQVILLDFWATWCPPCVEALPKVSAVAKKYADRGVVFRAVNSGEDAATIKEFLKASELDVPAILDLEGEIAQLYKTEAIPQTVLIGKDGRVQVVHVGYNETMPEELDKAIEKLLAGEDLATAELEKWAAKKGAKEKDAAAKEAEAAEQPDATAPAEGAAPATE
jgi:thiol-disulfide isomerase/thioredoxin